MIAAGKCNVALITYGSSSHSDRRAIGTPRHWCGPASPINNMEIPGPTLIGNYAMVNPAHVPVWHHHEQFAAISVATRRHAMRNPEAVKAMTDIEFVGVRDLTRKMLDRADRLSSAVAGVLHGLRRRRCRDYLLARRRS